ARVCAAPQRDVLLGVVPWPPSAPDPPPPPLSVSFLVKGTLVNARSRTRGRSFYAFYESPKRPFAAWAKNAGQPLREELWRGIESIAEQIAREIPPPPAAPGVLAGGGG